MCDYVIERRPTNLNIKDSFFSLIIKFTFDRSKKCEKDFKKKNCKKVR